MIPINLFARHITNHIYDKHIMLNITLEITDMISDML